MNRIIVKQKQVYPFEMLLTMGIIFLVGFAAGAAVLWTNHPLLVEAYEEQQKCKLFHLLPANTKCIVTVSAAPPTN